MSKVLGKSRIHKEINVKVSSHKDLCELLEASGLEKYAHQEKDRISWVLKDWRFDLDKYPEMPAYLEIEGKDEAHVVLALKTLSLENRKTNNGGERALIQKVYGLNWYDMRFPRAS